MPRICVVVTARPSYSRVRTLIAALCQQPDIELQVIVACSALLTRYGAVVDVMRADGVPIAAEVWATFEGENLITSARGAGTALTEFASVFARLKPDLVVIHADRGELLGVASAARLMECRTVHLQGGEQTGTVDDAVRHALTQLADYHLVSTASAARAVVRMRGGLANGVYVTGCPSIDLCVGLEDAPPVTVEELGGAGVALPDGPLSPGAVILQHPTTDHWDRAYGEMQATLNACAAVAPGPVIAFWPGNEAGSDGSSKALREAQGWLHTVRNLPPTRFLKLLTQSRMLVGNSSCGIRECSYLGVPVVNIGTRQHRRERGENVVDVRAFDATRIAAAVAYQLDQGRYPTSELYGDGRAGRYMGEVLYLIAKSLETRDNSGARAC